MARTRMMRDIRLHLDAEEEFLMEVHDRTHRPFADDDARVLKEEFGRGYHRVTRRHLLIRKPVRIRARRIAPAGRHRP